MWRRPRSPLLAVAGLGVGALACNAAIGGGVVALAGGAGILAAQCYDQVRIRVRDDNGYRTCDARVSVSSGSSERRLRPCYHASLTEGRHQVSVHREGYSSQLVDVDVPERKGACPHYTHTLEFTLRRLGAPAPPPTFGRHQPAAATESAPRAPARLPPPIPTPAAAATSVPAAIPPAAATPAATPAATSPVTPAAAPAGPPSAAFPSVPAVPPVPAAPAVPAVPAAPRP